MNAFETLVASLFEQDGYWVKPTFKVELTKEEKRKIGRHSSPRWELDLVAYKGSENRILVIECKSYLDSPGVRASGFIGDNEKQKVRYKLFNEKILRDTVLSRLSKQLYQSGLCAKAPDIKLCLAAGKIATKEDHSKLIYHFKEKGWNLYDDVWLRSKLKDVSNSGYENQVSSIVAKLLLRENASK